MAEILDAKIITLDDADAGTVQCQIDYDWEGNMYGTDDNGDPETVTSFYLDEAIDLVLQLPVGYSLVNIKTSNGNTITSWSQVSRTVEILDKLFDSSEAQPITWRPNTGLTITNDHSPGGSTVLTVEDNEVSSSRFPIVLDFNYGTSVYSFSTLHPAGVELEEDETFPQGLVVEVQKG